MKRNLFIASIAAIASLGSFGSVGAPAQSVLVVKATAPSSGPISPAERKLIGGFRSRTAIAKEWPFNGKNRAQRARLLNGFCAMA